MSNPTEYSINNAGDVIYGAAKRWWFGYLDSAERICIPAAVDAARQQR
jgi:hypothetical protein